MSFKDNNNREYVCAISLQTSIDLKKIGVDLGGHFDGSLWTRLSEDPELLVNALALVCDASIKSHNLTNQQFAESLGGDSLEAAVTAFTEALTDFFPSRQRTALKTMNKKAIELQNLQMTKLEQMINEINPENLLTSLNTFTNKQASSASPLVTSVGSGSEN